MSKVYDKKDELGRISLWVDQRPDSKTLATGKIMLEIPGEEPREISVFLYDNAKKQSDKSPDYFGFLKAAPAKKVLFNKAVTQYSDTTPVTSDDNDLAF